MFFSRTVLLFFLISLFSPVTFAEDDDLLLGDDEEFVPPPPKKKAAKNEDDDLLGGDEEFVPPAPKKKAPKAKVGVHAGESFNPHADVLKHKFPSAKQCATCHQTIYNEWRLSSHAYASISPMFHKFEQKINDLASGTINNFCVRCHASVGTTMMEPRELEIWKRSQVGREGVTCISCHRINEEYFKTNGERRIVPGTIHEPVYNSGDGKGIKEVLSKKDFYKVTTDGKGIGMNIHNGVKTFKTIGKSEFCMSCHQVAVHPGIKLEVVWDQYRSSPAHKNGVSCQECHMGRVPGKAEGYTTGPAADNFPDINPNRRHSNHTFYGPGYPIAHPGLFPHHPDAGDFTPQAWLKFNYRSDWGKEDFEAKVEAGKVKPKFPEEWLSVDDRFDARAIIDENLKLLEKKKKLRKAVMENGSHIDGPFFKGDRRVGESLSFYYNIKNTNDGHNLPSGSLGAQPEIWLNVVLTGPDGKRLWESGYVDSWGDMADLHSEDVQKGLIEHDDQLFNLQTKFLTTNVKGTDREMFLPINMDIDQIPFIRPANAPNSVLNHPAFIRMEGRSIPPLGERKAKYKVPAKLIQQKGKYKLSVRMRSRAEPIYFMKFVEATTEMIRTMNEWMLDIHPYTVEFEVK